MNKGIDLLIIGVICIFIFASCSKPKIKNSNLDFLDLDCSGNSLKKIVSNDRNYPAFAIENEIEALIEFKIKLDNKYIVTIIEEQYYIRFPLEPQDKDYPIGEIFSSFIEKEMNKNCIRQGQTSKSNTIRVAYKLKTSNFNPNKKQYDLIIEREYFQPIKQNSH